jgi:fumarylpyruvate hydrolase
VFSIAQPMLPIVGTSDMFPVRRIYCIGRNYAAHAREMGSDPTREPPFFFQKPSDAIQFVAPGTTADHPYPTLTKNYHYEIELVAALDKGGRNLSNEQALDLVFGYTVGLDMTRRDLQGEAKKLGRPWEVGKAFESAAPCSEIVPASAIGHPAQGAVWLKVNGEPRQKGDLNQLIWKVPEMIVYLSGLFELRAGDLIFSGTPAGVGPVKRGDVLHGGVDGVGELKVTVG